MPRRCRLAIALFTAGKQPEFRPGAGDGRAAHRLHSQPEILRVFLEIQLRFALAGSDMTGGARARVRAGGAALLGIAPQLLARMEAALRGGDGRAGAAPRISAERALPPPIARWKSMPPSPTTS